VDIEKTSDSNHQRSLLNILNIIFFKVDKSNRGHPQKYRTSSSVKITTGLRQGDAQSSILLNLVLEKVIREINVNVNDGIVLENSNIYLRT